MWLASTEMICRLEVNSAEQSLSPEVSVSHDLNDDLTTNLLSLFLPFARVDYSGHLNIAPGGAKRQVPAKKYCPTAKPAF